MYTSVLSACDYVFTTMYIAGVHEGQKRHQSDPGIIVIADCELQCVLASEAGSFARAASALYC